MKYSLLSLVKHVMYYEVLGCIFLGTNADFIEATLYEHILLVLKDILEEFFVYFGFLNKELIKRFHPDKDLFMKI